MVVASCAVADCVTTLMSTRARSGATETVASPTAVTDGAREGTCAHDVAARARATSNFVSLMINLSWPAYLCLLPPPVSGAILFVAGYAGRVQLLVQGDDGVEVLRLGGL